MFCMKDEGYVYSKSRISTRNYAFDVIVHMNNNYTLAANNTSAVLQI